MPGFCQWSRAPPGPRGPFTTHGGGGRPVQSARSAPPSPAHRGGRDSKWISVCSIEVQQPHHTRPTATDLYHPRQERKSLQRPCRHELRIRRYGPGSSRAAMRRSATRLEHHPKTIAILHRPDVYLTYRRPASAMSRYRHSAPKLARACRSNGPSRNSSRRRTQCGWLHRLARASQRDWPQGWQKRLRVQVASRESLVARPRPPGRPVSGQCGQAARIRIHPVVQLRGRSVAAACPLCA